MSIQQSQNPNERLLNDAMSTPGLESFYESVEKQIADRMSGDASVAPKERTNKLWIGFAGSAVILILAAAIILYVRSTDNTVVHRIDPSAELTPQAPTANPSVAPTTEQPVSRVQAPSQQKQLMKSPGGATSETKVTAHTEQPKSLTAQTQNTIDSLERALQSANSPTDQARIGYQLGVRYRIAGNNGKALTLLLSSSNTAKTVGANLLAARGRQQAAKAAVDLGDQQQALHLYDQALLLLPSTEQALRDRWNLELDSLKR